MTPLDYQGLGWCWRQTDTKIALFAAQLVKALETDEQGIDYFVVGAPACDLIFAQDKVSGQ